MSERIGGKYELVRQIGTGVLGGVWEAEGPGSAEHVAVKLMSCPTEELVGRILDEARNARDVAHPNLVKILDVGEMRASEPFVVMELLSGETLSDRLARERRLVPELAARIGREIALALTAAHGARLVHGDLKPSNVFLCGEPGTSEPMVKLLDLWVARCIDPELADTLGLSAPWYKSPEQIATRQSTDMRMDLWALGVVLFEMLAGQRPWGGAKETAIEQIKAGAIPRISSIVSEIDPALEEMVARCLERERDKRIGSAMVFSHMLEVFAGPARSAAPRANATGAGAQEGGTPALLQSDPGPRGQLGTLVMDGPASEPIPSAPTPSAPFSGPLGTMVMGPGPQPPSPARHEPRPPEPRAPELTQVMDDGETEPYGKTMQLDPIPLQAIAPMAPTPGRVTMVSPRAPSPTYVEATPHESRTIVIAMLVAGVVVLIGLVVLFVLL
jgi:serine/threonine protein kinase